jgi:mRNA interferase RelE/StbE
MTYTLAYHPLVRPEDIPKINRNIQERIADAIATRLTTHPELYGRPLTANLGGYWKLRAGDYRVIFKVTSDKIYIYGIIHRKKAYQQVLKRIGH